MAHTQKPDFIFRWNGRVHLNQRGRQFSRLLAAEVCASAVVMLDAPCSEVAWRVLATHSVRQFPLHFPFSASPCAITFQLDSTRRSKIFWSNPSITTKILYCFWNFVSFMMCFGQLGHLQVTCSIYTTLQKKFSHAFYIYCLLAKDGQVGWNVCRLWKQRV
jgi:hypothetical protein